MLEEPECKDEEWFAFVPHLMIVRSDGSWVAPPQPIWFGTTPLDAPTAELEEVYQPNLQPLFSIEVDSWIERISDSEGVLHTTWLLTDPNGSSSAEWTPESGYLPETLDLSLLVENQTLDCVLAQNGLSDCESGIAVSSGRMRLVAAPEMGSVYGEIAAGTILAMLRWLFPRRKYVLRFP